MSDLKRVDVTLLGQTVSIRTEASPEYVQGLARFVEERVQSVRKAGVADFTKAMLLAALDIADELSRAREERHRTEGDVGARLGALLAELERVTPPRPSPQPPS
jgi:cell division protein ZapA (FtsZ GTPase activity inhibitor)